MAMHNRFVRLSSASASAAMIGGAAIVICLGVLNRPGHAGEPSAGAARTVFAPAPAAPPLARAPADAPIKKTDKLAATTGPARLGGDPARREPRRANPGDSDAYRCHPNEDIACTVVRETAQGMTIVTMRPGGQASSAASWSVVSGTPAGATAFPGGIIYVVPTVSPAPPQFQAMAQTQEPTYTANNAPILE